MTDPDKKYFEEKIDILEFDCSKFKLQSGANEELAKQYAFQIRNIKRVIGGLKGLVEKKSHEAEVWQGKFEELLRNVTPKEVDDGSS